METCLSQFYTDLGSWAKRIVLVIYSHSVVTSNQVFGIQYQESRSTKILPVIFPSKIRSIFSFNSSREHSVVISFR